MTVCDEPLTGGVNPQEVRANVGYFEEVIPAAFWRALRDARLVDSDAPLPDLSTPRVGENLEPGLLDLAD